ncbi:YccT family protein [Marinomonas sp. TW1]|uniref:YccT family protein n=1 Tax=Marinomonas sp. TW1 TaxID=1561203 RepID=UPI0007AFD6E4|nr:DUF2057 domain-containing protein [Marinomonas sp. TW1]KZN12762.1 hypothetical protein OA79_14010 [Marinomonas sp. TW1]
MWKNKWLTYLSLTLSTFTTLSAYGETLEVPRWFEIMYVDQQEAKQFGNDFDVSLTPGQHQIVLRFNKILRTGGDSEVFQSEPIVMDVEVTQGAYLQLKAPYISTSRQAEEYAAAPTFTLHDEASGREVSFQKRVLKEKSGLQNLRDYLVEVKQLNGTSDESNGPSAAPVRMETNPALGMLKFWYNRSDSATRKAMRIWIADSQYQADVSNIQLEMMLLWYKKADDGARKAFQVWLVNE